MRPSVLFGDRKEFRLGRKDSRKGIMSAFSFLIPSKYKPVHGRDVAKAMMNVVRLSQKTYKIHEYKEITELTKPTKIIRNNILETTIRDKY